MNMKLHEKIYSQRRLKGFSQEELAEKLGVSRQAVSKWETGEALPEITKLKGLAEVFGVTTDFLLNDNQDVFVKGQVNSLDPFDRFMDWFEALPAKLAPFFKRYGWLGGIVLIVFGIYRLVNVFAGLVMMDNVPLGVTGMTVPFLFTWFMSGAVGIAFIVAGIVIIKKFKPKKNK
ncbi:MAG: helix-turn-helix transcriptional regulator [Clostridia bacterium]|nr:helix-turn-helix transcriptional regulator [Clostridia bacterium]